MNIRQAKKICNNAICGDLHYYKDHQVKEAARVWAKSFTRYVRKTKKVDENETPPFIFVETSNTIEEGVE